jgi:hypothetical protein
VAFLPHPAAFVTTSAAVQVKVIVFDQYGRERQVEPPS